MTGDFKGLVEEDFQTVHASSEVDHVVPSSTKSRLPEARRLLKSLWGYDDFRPLQSEVIEALLDGRDSVVVLPTGGGKSLCYQIPALLQPGLAIVVSPLISLMLDQVSSLREVGVAAAAVHSGSSPQERQEVAHGIRTGELKLLYLSPERLMSGKMLGFLEQVSLSLIAIDEAHCISDWGHDFRPEYRMLRELKTRFPGVPVHAFTATATGEVRRDIAAQLHIESPLYHVGSFDRPNLVYRVVPRTDRDAQILAVIKRHPGESGVIYCPRRKDVDEVTAMLRGKGFKALPYHAGLADEDRHANQNAFLNDRAEIIVATVAFGMGIDKSDVRYVIHAGAPKSLEAYQQESGRAGRDGLEAECWLFHSGADFALWRRFQSDLPPEAQKTAQQVLAGMEGFCQSATCRHRAIVEYFGQPGSDEACGACDICLGEVAQIADPLILSQKILSCVVRVEQNYGADHVSKVLVGSRIEKILSSGHDKLSTYGLLRDHDVKSIRTWIEQLVAQGYLVKAGEYGVLKVTPSGRLLLKGEGAPRLLAAPVNGTSAGGTKSSRVAEVSWAGVDRGLFDVLRELRKSLATERGVPPFIIFGDAPLREMASVRPSTTTAFRQISGVGDKKTTQYGETFVAAIVAHCASHGLTTDAAPLRETPTQKSPTEQIARDGSTRENSASKNTAFELFAQGQSVESVAQTMNRAPSTVSQYLEEFIAEEGLVEGEPWVAKELFEKIAAAFLPEGENRLKPAFDRLAGTATYEQLRIVRACLKNRAT